VEDWLGVASSTLEEDAMIALDDAAAHNVPSNVPAGATTTSSIIMRVPSRRFHRVAKGLALREGTFRTK
jgi:hypothetical protein